MKITSVAIVGKYYQSHLKKVNPQFILFALPYIAYFLELLDMRFNPFERNLAPGKENHL